VAGKSSAWNFLTELPCRLDCADNESAIYAADRLNFPRMFFWCARTISIQPKTLQIEEGSTISKLF
jgi:hypothetical protein